MVKVRAGLVTALSLLIACSAQLGFAEDQRVTFRLIGDGAPIGRVILSHEFDGVEYALPCAFQFGAPITPLNQNDQECRVTLPATGKVIARARWSDLSSTVGDWSVRFGGWGESCVGFGSNDAPYQSFRCDIPLNGEDKLLHIKFSTISGGIDEPGTPTPSPSPSPSASPTSSPSPTPTGSPTPPPSTLPSPSPTPEGTSTPSLDPASKRAEFSRKVEDIYETLASFLGARTKKTPGTIFSFSPLGSSGFEEGELFVEIYRVEKIKPKGQNAGKKQGAKLKQVNLMKGNILQPAPAYLSKWSKSGKKLLNDNAKKKKSVGVILKITGRYPTGEEYIQSGKVTIRGLSLGRAGAAKKKLNHRMK